MSACRELHVEQNVMCELLILEVLCLGHDALVVFAITLLHLHGAGANLSA